MRKAYNHLMVMIPPNQWSLPNHLMVKNPSNGAAVYANGDAKQSLASDGFVKAGVYIDNCGPTAIIQSYFNNVNTSAITVIPGGTGACTVDFNFDVSTRFIVATSRSSTAR